MFGLIDACEEYWTSPDAQAHFTAALTRRSWLLEHGQTYGRHHEDLEWLGDRVLGLVVADELMRRFPGHQPGELDPTFDRLVDAPHLASLARRYDLLSKLRLGRGERLQRQVEEDKPLSDHIEALCGAAYQAGGWEGARALVLRIFEGAWPEALTISRTSEAATASNPLGALNTLLQDRYRSTFPADELWTVEPPGQAAHYTATLTLPDGATFVVGPEPGNKANAKKLASARAVAYLLDLAST